MQFQIIDAKGQPVAQPFKSERLALEAKRVYQEHCESIPLPMKVVPVADKQLDAEKELVTA